MVSLDVQAERDSVVRSSMCGNVLGQNPEPQVAHQLLQSTLFYLEQGWGTLVLQSHSPAPCC